MDPVSVFVTGVAGNIFTDFATDEIESLFQTAARLNPSLEPDMRAASTTQDVERIFRDVIGIIDARVGDVEIEVDEALLSALRGIRFDHAGGEIHIADATVKASVLVMGGQAGYAGKDTIDIKAPLKNGRVEIDVGQGAQMEMTATWQRLENPFLNRNKVTDPAEFYGRQEIIESILTRIRHSEPQSVAIVGARRIGKSSLLTHLHHLMTTKTPGAPDPLDKRTCILLDPEELVINDPDGFTWVIIDELISANPQLVEYLQERPKEVTKKSMPSMPARRPETILNNLLKRACNAGHRFVFFFDEFELLARNPQLREVNYLHYLRSISDNYKLAFVTVSHVPVSDISFEADSTGSPFDNNFSQPVHMGLMSEDDCFKLVRGQLAKPEDGQGLFKDFDVQEAIELAGRHPYFFKIACSCLFDWTRDKKRGRPWQEAFQEQANEEFDRMWRAFNNEERNWILRAQQTGDVAHDNYHVPDVLESLAEKGLVQRPTDDSCYNLFSLGFSNYISQRVTALEKEYAETERRIRDGAVTWELSVLRATVNHLKDLTEEWKRRDEITSSFETTRGKCEKLTAVLTKIQLFVEAMQAFEESDDSKHRSGGPYKIRVEDALKDVLGLLSKRDWFRRGAENEACLTFETGANLLERMADYMNEKERGRIFGNGYDETLTTQINYMKYYGACNFEGFAHKFEQSFDRLVKVHDFSRAMDILRPRFGRFFEHLTKFFLRWPMLTIFAAIVIFPLILAGYIQSPPQASMYWPGIAALALLLVVHAPLVYQLVYSAFFRKQNWLPDAHKFYYALLFPRGALAAMGSFAAAGGIAYTFREQVSSKPEYSIPVAIAVILGSMVVYAGFLQRRYKLLGFGIALRRAKYFCSIQFIQAFWVTMLMSLLLGALLGDFSNAEPHMLIWGILPRTVGIPQFAVFVPFVLSWSALTLAIGVFAVMSKES